MAYIPKVIVNGYTVQPIVLLKILNVIDSGEPVYVQSHNMRALESLGIVERGPDDKYRIYHEPKKRSFVKEMETYLENNMKEKS